MSELEPIRPVQYQVSKPQDDVAAGPARLFTELKDAIQEFDAEVAADPRAANQYQTQSQGPQNQGQSPALPPVPDHPRLIESLMKNAGILIENREYRLAINILRNVLFRAPDHPEALLRMGVCMRETSHYEEALKCFKALAKVRQDATSFAALGDIYYLLENDPNARQAYLEALKMGIAETERLFDVFKNLGNIYVRAGDFDLAEEYYDKAYAISRQSDILLVNYGTLEIQRERFDEAVERFRVAIDINPQNDRAWVGLAMVYRHKGDYELARANVERALDINRSNRTALRLMIDWGVQDGAWNSVISSLTEYLDENGEDAEMAFTLARVFTHVGRLKEARFEIERVLALDPTTEGAEPLKIALDREISRIEGHTTGAKE
jgi:tetratricopeptide (TPR) repeat protein